MRTGDLDHLLLKLDAELCDDARYIDIRDHISYIIENEPTIESDEVLKKKVETYQTAYRIISDAFEGEVKKNIELRGSWIPVSERLPEDMQKVLIWFEYYRYRDYNCMFQTYGFGYVCDGKWSPFINGETGWTAAHIIAWMPLPEPYKEEV